MNLLLDTNALIWSMEQVTRKSLGLQAIEVIISSQNVYASSISIVEIRIKTMTGRLTAASDLIEDISRANIQLLDFPAAAADVILDFPSLIRHDPFDRMILAHAKTKNLTLITSDATLLGLGLPYVIDATL